MSQQLYKPAEACKIAEVAPYVLRYWETEFPALSEGKEKIGPRAYTERDVRVIARIRELLYDEGFTVAGAKKRLEAEIAEGRFDDGLKTALPPAEQRSPRKAEPVPATAPVSPPPAAAKPRASNPAPVASAAAPAPPPPQRPADPAPALAPPRLSSSVAIKTAPEGDFPDRKRVLRELKDIARILDRSLKK